MDQEQARQRATKRADAKLGLYIHFAVYVVVIALLVAINLTSSPSYYWFKWPMMGWGLGLAFHALSVFVFTGGGTLRKRMIEHELQRDAPS